MTDLQIQGEVVAVTSEPQGGIVTSWVGSQMAVLNAADFSREGGQFTPDDGVTIVDYLSVLDGATEEDPDLVTTATPAPAGWGAGEVPVRIWPPAVDVIAEVAVEGDDTLPCTVPHALRAVLAEGVRDSADRERVLCELRGSEWVVADIVGRLAMVRKDAVEGLDEALSDLAGRLAVSADDLAAAKLDLEQRAKANEDALAAARVELASADKVMAGQINAAMSAASAAQVTADQAVRDAASAASRAASAQSAADKASADAAALAERSGTYVGPTAPSDTTVLWIDTANGNAPKVWDGAKWVIVQDSSIQAAAQKASDALSAANSAKVAADAAAAKASTATSSAATAQKAADAAQAAASKTAVDLATAQAALSAMDAQLASKGTDLVINGNGSMGDNTNWQNIGIDTANPLVFTPTDAPMGAVGSLYASANKATTQMCQQLIPYDPSKAYKFSFQARQAGTSTTARMYGMFIPYDAAGLMISPNQYMFIPGTTTTLAADLNPGDTTVKLTSAANWWGAPGKSAGGSIHLRSMIFWGYTDKFGKTWAPETYSRNYWKADVWADGGVDLATNTITLRAGWAGPKYAAGTPLSNGSSGGAYIYMTGAANVVVPPEWTTYSGIFPAQTAPLAQAAATGNVATWNTPMPPATAQLKVGWLTNYGTSTNSQHAVANVSLSDAAAAQSASAAAQARADLAVTNAKAADDKAVAAQASATTAAQQAAAAANASKAVVQSIAPVDRTVLWIDSADGNTPKLWNDTVGAWAVVSDAGIKAAADKAAAAQSTADAAKATADQAKADAAAAQSTANQAKTAAETADAKAVAAQAGADKAKADAAAAQSTADQAKANAATAQTAADAAKADAAKVAGASKAVAQATAPADRTVLWIDTNSGANTPKVWSGSAWTALTDKAATDAAAKAVVAQSTADAAASKAAAAQSTADAAKAAAMAAQQTADQAKAAAATAQAAADAAKAQADKAVASAATAQGTADAAKADAAAAAGAPKAVIQATAPADRTVLWIDSANGSQPKLWSGSAWVVATDSRITAAASAASAAQATANTAKSTADTARNEAAAAQGTANGAVTDARNAKTIADSKGKSTYATGLPGATPNSAGDQWFIRTATGAIIELWEGKGGTSWQRVQMDGATLVAESIQALHLAVGSVTADKVLANESYARIIGGLLANFEQVFANKVTADMLVADQVLAGKVAALVGDFADLFASKVTAKMLNVDEAMAQKLQAVIATFQSVFAGTIVADMIDLDTLRGKVLNGVGIFSPSSTATPRSEITDGHIRTIRKDRDGNEVVGVDIGGDTADRLVVLDPTTGNVLGGVQEDGGLVGRSVGVVGGVSAGGDVSGRRVIAGGVDLVRELATKPGGVYAMQRLGSSAAGNTVKFGSTWLGYYDLFFAPNGRTTRVAYAGSVYVSGPGYYAFRLIATSDPDPTVMPASAKADGSVGTQIGFAGFQASAAGIYPLQVSGIVQPTTGSWRVLVAAACASGGGNGYLWSQDGSPAWFTAEDLGTYYSLSNGGYNRGGGTPYTGSPVVTETAPVAVKRSYTTTWQASEVATWRNTTKVANPQTEDLRQGTYGGIMRYAHILFGAGAIAGSEKGKTLAAAIGTASSIESVTLRINVVHTYAYAGAKLLAAASAAAAIPASPETGAATTTKLVKTGSQEITLTNTQGRYLRSISLGASNATISDYLRIDPDLTTITLEVSYTK